MSIVEVNVPDIGVEGEVEIIEICVSVGDVLEEDAPIVVLESDKATVEVPSPSAGKVTAVSVKLGDKVKEGIALISMESDVAQGAESEPKPEAAETTELSNEPESEPEAQAKPEPSAQRQEIVKVPDLGGAEKVEVIEVLVSEGDQISEDDTLIVLESDKATMEIPSPSSGLLQKLVIKVGDTVSEGDTIAEMTVKSEGDVPEPSNKTEDGKENLASSQVSAPKTKTPSVPAASQAPTTFESDASAKVHAGPAVRKLARELGADLSRVKASGPRNRILKDDLHAYVKSQVQSAQQGGGSGAGLPSVKLPDFSTFGEVEIRGMDKIQKVTAENMQTSWLTVPHVTQFDEADITNMESFRKQQKAIGESKGIKLTPVAFLLKACAYAIEALPQFNVSIDMQNAQIVQKKYIHIGLAVDTPAGLVVPVIRDVNKKSLWELAEECQTVAKKAKDKKLLPADMQGGCFTISSLGGIGGTAFTPIVNTPEVAILGVSKSQIKPVYNGTEFEPRLMLPLSLSYDHRAVNGADAARFTSMLGKVLGDLRELLL